MIQRSMGRGNLNMMPMSADDKPLVLQKLQGSILFEKTLTATTAASFSYKKTGGLTIPSWFVHRHGDKIRKSTILRTESSTETWPVKLSISLYSPTKTAQVRFTGGWRAFAIFHGLLEGDLLVFTLMAMSEFKVYIFRSREGPCKNPSRKQRRCACNSAHPRKKAKQPYRKARDARLSADGEGSDEGKNSSNRNSSAVYDCAIAPTRPSSKEDSSHHLPSFEKTLTVSNVRGDGLAQLEFPGGFCRKYGNRIRTMVKLQGIHEQSPERTMACHTSFGKDIRHYLKAEWRAFVTENHLHAGQQLVFTLSADSFFVVRERSALQLGIARIETTQSVVIFSS